MDNDKQNAYTKEKENEIAIAPEVREIILRGARKSWQYEDVVIPENAEIFFGINGAWVSARVWVPIEDYQDEIASFAKTKVKSKLGPKPKIKSEPELKVV